MEITGTVYNDGTHAQVSVEVDIKAEYPEYSGKLELTPRWKNAAKIVRRFAEIPEDFEVVQIDAGFITPRHYRARQEFQFSYIKREK